MSEAHVRETQRQFELWQHILEEHGDYPITLPFRLVAVRLPFGFGKQFSNLSREFGKQKWEFLIEWFREYIRMEHEDVKDLCRFCFQKRTKENHGPVAVGSDTGKCTFSFGGKNRVGRLSEGDVRCFVCECGRSGLQVDRPEGESAMEQRSDDGLGAGDWSPIIGGKGGKSQNSSPVSRKRGRSSEIVLPVDPGEKVPDEMLCGVRKRQCDRRDDSQTVSRSADAVLQCLEGLEAPSTGGSGRELADILFSSGSRDKGGVRGKEQGGEGRDDSSKELHGETGSGRRGVTGGTGDQRKGDACRRNLFGTAPKEIEDGVVPTVPSSPEFLFLDKADDADTEAMAVEPQGVRSDKPVELGDDDSDEGLDVQGVDSVFGDDGSRNEDDSAADLVQRCERVCGRVSRIEGIKAYSDHSTELVPALDCMLRNATALVPGKDLRDGTRIEHVLGAALSVLATQDKRKPFWNLSLMSIADYYTLAKEIMDLSDLSMLIKLQEGETDYHKFQNALPTRPLKPMQPKLIRPKYDVTCSTLMNQFVVTPFGKMEIDQTYRIKYLSAKGQVKVTRSEYQRGHNFVFKISQLADHFGECYWCSLERSPTEQTNQLCGDGLLILLDIVCDLFAGYENIDVSVFAKVVREKVDEIDICQVDLKALLLNVIHCFSNNEDALLQAAYCLMDEEYTEELLTADLCELPLGLILAIDLVTLQTIHWIKGLIQAQYHPLVPHYIAKYALDNLVANPGNKTLRPSICDEYRQAIGSQFGRCHSMVNAVVTAQNDTEFLKGMLKQVPLVIVVRDESRENLGFFRVKPAYRELFEACLNDKNVVIDPKKMRTLIIETESKGKRVEPGWLSKTFPMDCIAPYDTDILLRDICNGATMKRDDYAAVALALERDMDMIHQNHELPFYAYVHKKAQSLRIASTGGNMSSYAGILDMDFIVTSLYHLFLFKPSIKPSSIDKWQGLKLKSAKAAIMEQVRLTDSADYHIYISNQHLIDFASGFIQEDRMMDPETQKYVHPRIPKPFHEMHESLATTQGNENAWKDFCDPLGLPSLEPLATLERKYEPQFLHGDMMVTVFTERGGLLGVGQGWWNSKKNRFMYRAQYLVEAYVGDFSPLCPIHLKSGVYCYPYFAFHTAVVYLEDVLLDREMLGIGKTILSNSNVMNSDVMKLIVHFEVDRIQKLDLAVKRLKDWYVPLANAMYEMFGSIWITKEYFNDHLETMFLLFAFWFLHLAIIEHREHSVPKELLESNYNKIVKQLPSLFPIEVYVGPKKKATYIGRTGWSFAIDCVFRDYTHKPHYCYPRFNLPFPELNESRSKLEVMRNIHPERLKGIFRKSCAIKLMWNHKKGKPVTGWKDIVYTKWQEPLGFCFGCKRECDKWVRRSPVELCNRCKVKYARCCVHNVCYKHELICLACNATESYELVPDRVTLTHTCQSIDYFPFCELVDNHLDMCVSQTPLTQMIENILEVTSLAKTGGWGAEQMAAIQEDTSLNYMDTHEKTYEGVNLDPEFENRASFGEVMLQRKTRVYWTKPCSNRVNESQEVLWRQVMGNWDRYCFSGDHGQVLKHKRFSSFVTDKFSALVTDLKQFSDSQYRYYKNNSFELPLLPSFDATLDTSNHVMMLWEKAKLSGKLFLWEKADVCSSWNLYSSFMLKMGDNNPFFPHIHAMQLYNLECYCQWHFIHREVIDIKEIMLELMDNAQVNRDYYIGSVRKCYASRHLVPIAHKFCMERSVDYLAIVKEYEGIGDLNTDKRIQAAVSEKIRLITEGVGTLWERSLGRLRRKLQSAETSEGLVKVVTHTEPSGTHVFFNGSQLQEGSIPNSVVDYSLSFVTGLVSDVLKVFNEHCRFPVEFVPTPTDEEITQLSKPKELCIVIHEDTEVKEMDTMETEVKQSTREEQDKAGDVEGGPRKSAMEHSPERRMQQLRRQFSQVPSSGFKFTPDYTDDYHPRGMSQKRLDSITQEVVKSPSTLLLRSPPAKRKAVIQKDESMECTIVEKHGSNKMVTADKQEIDSIETTSEEVWQPLFDMEGYICPSTGEKSIRFPTGRLVKSEPYLTEEQKRAREQQEIPTPPISPPKKAVNPNPKILFVGNKPAGTEPKTPNKTPKYFKNHNLKRNGQFLHPSALGVGQTAFDEDGAVFIKIKEKGVSLRCIRTPPATGTTENDHWIATRYEIKPETSVETLSKSTALSKDNEEQLQMIMGLRMNMDDVMKRGKNQTLFCYNPGVKNCRHVVYHPEKHGDIPYLYTSTTDLSGITWTRSTNTPTDCGRTKCTSGEAEFDEDGQILLQDKSIYPSQKRDLERNICMKDVWMNTMHITKTVTSVKNNRYAELFHEWKKATVRGAVNTYDQNRKAKKRKPIKWTVFTQVTTNHPYLVDVVPTCRCGSYMMVLFTPLNLYPHYYDDAGCWTGGTRSASKLLVICTGCNDYELIVLDCSIAIKLPGNLWLGIDIFDMLKDRGKLMVSFSAMEIIKKKLMSLCHIPCVDAIEYVNCTAMVEVKHYNKKK